MKITRKILDNGMKIIHINYEASDIEKTKKKDEVENKNILPEKTKS